MFTTLFGYFVTPAYPTYQAVTRATSEHVCNTSSSIHWLYMFGCGVVGMIIGAAAISVVARQLRRRAEDRGDQWRSECNKETIRANGYSSRIGELEGKLSHVRTCLEHEKIQRNKSDISLASCQLALTEQTELASKANLLANAASVENSKTNSAVNKLLHELGVRISEDALRVITDMKIKLGRCQNEIYALRAAIRKHYDQSKGHAACWENDEELWAVVDKSLKRTDLPPANEFLAKCIEYWNGHCLHKKDGDPVVVDHEHPCVMQHDCHLGDVNPIGIGVPQDIKGEQKKVPMTSDEMWQAIVKTPNTTTLPYKPHKRKG